MTAPERRVAVLAAYLEVARALNLIEDDEEREGAQAHGERLLNRELEDGAGNRAAADALLGGLAGLVPSVSNDPREGYDLNDPKRQAFEGGWDA